MKINVRRCISALGLLVAAFLLQSCATPAQKKVYTAEYKPRPDQGMWLEEKDVISNVVSLVISSGNWDSRQMLLQQYAYYLRTCYQEVSVSGTDEDAGVRILNYIRKIHFDANGDRKLWNDTVSLAKKGPASWEDTPMMAIPGDY